MTNLRNLAIAALLTSCAASSGALVNGRVEDANSELAGDSAGRIDSGQASAADVQAFYSEYQETASIAADIAAEQAAQEKLERTKKAEEDALLRMDILQAVDALIQEANEVAALEDDTVVVREYSFKRVVFFDPVALLGQDDAEEKQQLNETWTDHYTTAASQTYRYSRPRVQEIRREISAPILRATVELSLDMTSRFFVAGESLAAPKPPSGYSYVSGGRFGGRLGGKRNLRAARDAREDRVIPLGIVAPPRGEVYAGDEGVEPQTLEAADGLRAAATDSELRKVKLEMQYSYSLKQWILSSESRAQSSPTKTLSWSHGTEGSPVRDPSLYE